MRCRGCGKRVENSAEVVSLGRRHGFCSRKCLYSWAPDRVVELERALNLIFIRSRGRARKLALEALTGNLQGA